MVHFFAHLIRQRVFRACALTFPVPHHGASQIDGVFSTVKNVTTRVPVLSLPHLSRQLAPSGIEVRLLSRVLNTHGDLTPLMEALKITTAAKLCAWRFYFAEYVCFQARQYLGSRVHSGEQAAPADDVCVDLTAAIHSLMSRMRCRILIPPLTGLTSG